MRLFLIIVGAFAAIVCIASPALAQYGSDRKHVRIISHQSDPRALPSPPAQFLRDPRSWVGDPASRPYVYIPGQASGGGATSLALIAVQALPRNKM